MTTNPKKPPAKDADAQKAGDRDPRGKKPIPTEKPVDKPIERRGTLAALAVDIPKITQAAIGSRGFAEAGLITHWAAIIGADLARGCQPDQLKFPKGERTDGTLTLRCLGALALEIQHQTPYLLERINGYFGYRAIARLRLVQGTLRRRKQPAPLKLPPLAAADQAATEADLAALPDDEIKDALRRLGSAIRQRGKLPPQR